MNKNHRKTTVRNGLYRGFTALLCLVMLLGLVPALELSAQAASWAQPYLDQLVSWGVMRGDIDGNLHPERNITRAEFVTMMNRAYGYTETGGNPFTDVPPSAWYYDDIDIAYNVGYFTGTSATTASPNSQLTREQAAVLLARNMMLQGTSGETLGFTDSRELSSWSRGLVGAVANAGVISGYGDGSFRPRNSITRGEVAAMLTRAVGSLINKPGSQSLGSVYGNLTINSSGVSLRNTTIVGNLYLTGGIGLGDVLLENVDVRGQIIVAGAGEANSSRSSVIMRNVTANELIVDNISNQFVTVRAEGDTRIAKTSVRTNAYVEDTTPNGYGLSLIELNGEPGTKLQLAGNIKEVKNLTPQSSLEIVQGSAAKVTADEHATGSAVRIDTGARVDELNLDVGASVSGEGDIGAMNVAASGTNVGILPDDITVRPGITSNITGTAMDSVTAAESSADPRLLSGYPAVRNVAPNSATLVFSTNKAGTVYWAVSALADGSVSEDDLITNPTYGGSIIRSGRINASKSKTEYTAQVSGLTIDGSYYVSAILVDSRGNHSPLKVTAFSTPDNTTPAFTSGYPTMTKNTTKTAQVTVMTNKSCQMYYALLPRGSSTPTSRELKSGAVSGNLGYGVVDVVKNNTQPVNVNSIQLEEQTTYTLYLWLNDYDNARSSGVRSVQFTTPDETAPVVTDIRQTNSAANSVELNYMLNEPGTLYWAIVDGGNETFMNYELNSLEAKVKTEAGYGALSRGTSSASKADTAIRLAIGSLNTARYGTSFDVYYIAKDRAGNYAAAVGKINVRTLDGNAPDVSLEFTKYNDNSKNRPLADTNIRIVFTEGVQGGSDGKNVFLDLYSAVEKAREDAKDAARDKLAEALRKHIQLYRVPAAEQPVLVGDRSVPKFDATKNDWAIDYRYATVSTEEGKLVITLPTTADTSLDPSALNLDSGTRYRFHFEGIYDTALTPNAMGVKEIEFRTEIARVTLNETGSLLLSTAQDGYKVYDTETKKDITLNPDYNDGKNSQLRIDFAFSVDPVSVDRVDKDMLWDMLIWTDISMEYTLYFRDITNGQDSAKWQRLGSTSITMDENGGLIFKSLNKWFPKATATPDFGVLKDMSGKKYEYAIHIDKLGNSEDFTSWNNTVNFRVSLVAGSFPQLNNLAGSDGNTAAYNSAIEDGIYSIGWEDPFQKRRVFTDTSAPEISSGSPTIKLGDISATINIMLDRPGRVYYIAFPLSQLEDTKGNPLSGKDPVENISNYYTAAGVTGGIIYGPDGVTKIGDVTGRVDVADVPELGTRLMNVYKPNTPTVIDVTNGRFTSEVMKGSVDVLSANAAAQINLGGTTNQRLTPNTWYYVCLVTRGTANVYSERAVCYRFKTLEAVRPTIDLTVSGPNVAVNVYEHDADLDYFLVVSGNEPAEFNEPFFKLNGNVVENTDLVNKDVSKSSYTYPGKNGAMSVLQAMVTQCNSSSGYVGSVFDVFATEEAKSQYATLIRNQIQGGNVTTGSGQFLIANNGKDRNVIKCEQFLTSTNNHTLLAVAKSSEGSGDAFRAVLNVRKADTTPPMVDFTLISQNKPTNPAGTYSGTITLGFSEQLYSNGYSTGKGMLPVDDCFVNADHTKEADKYVRLVDMVAKGSSSSASVISGTNGHGVSVDTVVISFSGAHAGDGLIFSPDLTDAAGTGVNRTRLSVTLTYDKETDTYGCTITPAWDGRG